MMSRKSCKVAFTILCFVTVVFMVSYWFYKYEIEDRDIAVVDYVSLEEAKDVEFPVASICFVNPFKSSWINETSTDINTTSYLEYLKGELFDERFQHIDYERFTLNLSDYFLLGEELWKKESSYSSTLSIKHKQIYNGFYFHALTKCFTFQIEFGKRRSLKEIHLHYDLQQLLLDWFEGDGVRPMMFFDLQYPGQFLLRVTDASFLNLDKKDKSLTIWIQEIELLRSRSSRQRNCVENKEAYDDMVLMKHLSSNGCRAPYHSIDQSFPICNTQEKMKKSMYKFHNVRDEYCPKACHRISKLPFTNQRVFSVENISLVWTLTIAYPDDVRIITQYQEVDVHCLIGNIGGYIGLFLGNDIHFM